MCWPTSLTRRYSMHFGPRKMQISIAAIPAIRTSPMAGRALLCSPAANRIRYGFAVGSASGGPSQLRQRLRHRLQTRGARALDNDRVARLELLGEQLGRFPGVADQLVGVVVAGRLADADQQVDPLRAGVLADLAVVAGGAVPQLRHLAEDGDLARPVQGGEVVERGTRRDRVGVVAVVDQDDPLAQLEALAPEAGEAYVRSAVGHLGERRLQRHADRDGGQRVGQVVRLGEGEVEELPSRRGGDQRFGDALLDPPLYGVD